MARRRLHSESHTVGRSGWLRAAVLGADDGLLSTSSLILGVAAAAAPRESVLLSGIAGLVAGAMSMAAGEYVSVSSQADSEAADLTRERRELVADPEAERQELADIYVARGVAPVLARQVADQLMAKDALAAHAQDELGISEALAARPIQAAIASAASFALGAAPPLLIVLAAPRSVLSIAVGAASLLLLGALGAAGAHVGGANIWRAALRVTFWGALAMVTTTAIGAVLGTRVAP